MFDIQLCLKFSLYLCPHNMLISIKMNKMWMAAGLAVVLGACSQVNK